MTAAGREGQGRFTSFGICELSMIDPCRNRRRFYCIAVQPGLFAVAVIRQWGRLGCRLRQKGCFFTDMTEAVAWANRLYRTKVKRGYRELTDMSTENTIHGNIMDHRETDAPSIRYRSIPP